MPNEAKSAEEIETLRARARDIVTTLYVHYLGTFCADERTAVSLPEFRENHALQDDVLAHAQGVLVFARGLALHEQAASNAAEHEKRSAALV